MWKFFSGCFHFSWVKKKQLQLRVRKEKGYWSNKKENNRLGTIPAIKTCGLFKNPKSPFTLLAKTLHHLKNNEVHYIEEFSHDSQSHVEMLSFRKKVVVLHLFDRLCIQSQPEWLLLMWNLQRYLSQISVMTVSSHFMSSLPTNSFLLKVL